MSGGPRGERPSKHFLNSNLNFIKFKKQRTHALTHANMGNTKYEHAVVTAHKIDNVEVSTDMELLNFEHHIDHPGALDARANDFNNQLLSSVDDVFFPELFEFFELEEDTSSQKSDQSNFSFHNDSE